MRSSALVFVSVLLFFGCASEGESGGGREGWVKAGNGKADSSVEALIVDFEFDGEFVTDYTWNAASQIESQLLYTIGHLNADRSVGRLDKIQLSNVTETPEGTLTKITYHAKMPVAWGNKDDVPTSYDFTLPRDVSAAALEAFTEKYKDICVDWAAHEVDSGSMWYYYRPRSSGCELDAAEVINTTATVTVSTVNTTGKYPEYDKIWEDNSLRVVVIFGKYEDGATEPSDAGIGNYNNFVRGVKERFADAGLVTTPAELPDNPGVMAPDSAFDVTLADGKTVHIDGFLVDNVREAGPDFDARYHALTVNADLIIYNGHAGLGANIRALARKGTWTPGQYSIVFENGCDSYAYVDSALFDAHAAINADDPIGTKYLDVLINAMPSYFSEGRRGSIGLIDGLLSYETPKTYEQIFAALDPSQVVLVTGEEDNTFVPTPVDENPGDVVENWEGMTVEGTLALDAVENHETPNLAAGKYTFTITGTGDADLYVRVGTAPDFETYDCRPYRYGSAETCEIDLGSPSVVHVMVHGYEGDSQYSLEASLVPQP